MSGSSSNGFRRCAYCGEPTRRSYACAAHSDLPALDVARSDTIPTAGWRPLIAAAATAEPAQLPRAGSATVLASHA